MGAVTPNYKFTSEPGALESRYVDVSKLEWTPSKFPGIDTKVLMEDKETGLLTALFRWAPGSKLPLHEHVELEQTFVLEGSIEDSEGVATAGNYVWRPAGSRHVATSKNGAIVIGIFQRPNKFFE
jgi:anti-sigma factor ChrR (cupin superfamily)